MNLSGFKNVNKYFEKGFTLIELLIVIAILGVLAAGILVAIDPVDKIKSAQDAQVQNDVSAIGRATEAYSATHNGLYPATAGELFTSGELKRVPLPPTGGAYAYAPTGCAGGGCTGVVVSGVLGSKKFTAAGTPKWLYDSSNGKSCAGVATATGCI